METSLSYYHDSPDNPAPQVQHDQMMETLPSCHTPTNNPAAQAKEQTPVCQPTQDASIIGAQWFVDTDPPTSSLSDVYADQTSSTTPEEDIVEVKPVLVHSVPEVELIKNLSTSTSLSDNTKSLSVEQFYLNFNPRTYSVNESLLCDQENKMDIRQYVTELLSHSSTLPVPLHDLDNTVHSNQLLETLTVNERPSCVTSDVDQCSSNSLLVDSQEREVVQQLEVHKSQETLPHQPLQLVQVQEELSSVHQSLVQEIDKDKLKERIYTKRGKRGRPKEPLYRGTGKGGKKSVPQMCNADDELESHATSVIIEEKGVIQLWRTIGNWKELRTDGDIARFLLSLYFNPDHKGVQSTDRCVHCDQVLSYCCMSCLLSSRQPPSTHLTSHSTSDANCKQKQKYAVTSSSSQDGNWNTEPLQHQDNSGDDTAEEFCNDNESDIETQNEQEGPSNKKQRLDTGVKRKNTHFETKCQKSFNTTTTPVVKLTRCDAQPVSEQINRGELTSKASNFDSKHKNDGTNLVQASSSATKTGSKRQASDQSSSQTSTHSRQETYMTRRRGPLPQETVQEEERDKYPICDGKHFKHGHIPIMTYFSDLRCSKCNKTFETKIEILRHMKNPRCDTGDDLFRVIKKNRKQWHVFKSTAGDEDWAPPEQVEAELAEDASDEDVVSAEKRKRKMNHHNVKTSKVYNMEQFMTGKIQIPITSHWNRSGIYYSHYTCAKCSKVFTKIGQYKQHVADHKSDEASDLPPPQGPDPESLKILENIRDRLVHSCSFCDRIFFSVMQRDAHVYSHKYFIGDDGKFNCILCGEVFIKYSSLLYHLRGRKSKDMQKECGECGFKFLSLCQIQTHMKEHGITNTAVSCQVCETSFESLSKKEITAHLKTHKELQRMCLCTVCGKEVPTTRFSNHKLMHSKAPEYCKVCNLSFASLSKKEITAHLKTHKELRSMSLCTVCGIEMPTSQLSKHILIHSDVRPFKCPVCQKCFRTNAAMEYHKRIHGEKELQCEECGAKFSQPKQLKIHMEFKHQGITYDCKYCGRKLARKSSLREHIHSVHEKLKQFVCKFCGNRFRNKNELTNHERIHTGEKPYQCQYCPSTFARWDYLKYHVRTHTGEKPYQCEDCVEKFATRTSYTSHRKNHHRDKLYPCDQCSQVLLTKSDLAVHHKKWHDAETKSDVTSSSTDVVHVDMKTEAGVSDTSNSSDHVSIVFIPPSLI